MRWILTSIRLGLMRAAVCGSLVILFPLTASAQSSVQTHFSKDGVTFDYPADWVLTDKSTQQAQHLTITHPGISPLIMVIAYRDPILSRNQMVTAAIEITEPYIRNIVDKLGTAKAPAKRDSSCATVGDLTFGGIQ